MAEESFIYTGMLEDPALCDKLIQYHALSPTKTPGKTLNGVDKKRKDSTDCNFDLNCELGAQYVTALQKVVDEYIAKFPFCDNYAPWGFIEHPNIQHYAPGGGFFSWHTERPNAKFPSVARHLVFMTYLNDVTDGGETEFYYQKLKIQPQKGKTVIWPVDWTFTHRGIASPTQEKYILTGWFSFKE